MTTDTSPDLFNKPSNLLQLLWTQHSAYLLSAFLLTVALIVAVWWPLAVDYLAQADWQGQWWRYIDWLLIGIFAVMTVLLLAGADLRRDVPLALVAAAGGLVIESWGTQTELWTYYTFERPPLWIIPAWPVAALSIDRLVRLLDWSLPDAVSERWFWPFYGVIFGAFAVLMLAFVWPTIDKSLTVMALLLCGLLIAAPKDVRLTVLTFIAGAGLGYFLELWGTTRFCWTYYTKETPPFFAVLAHGMAAVAFWRVYLLGDVLLTNLQERTGWRWLHLPGPLQEEKETGP